MNFENKKSRIVIRIISIIIFTYCWINFKFPLDLIQFWLMGIVLAFANVFVLYKILKLWQIPITIIGLHVIYHSYWAISVYSNFNPASISMDSFLTALQYTYAGELRVVFLLTEIPFVILTILFTFGFYVLNKIKIEIRNTY